MEVFKESWNEEQESDPYQRNFGLVMFTEDYVLKFWEVVQEPRKNHFKHQLKDLLSYAQ